MVLVLMQRNGPCASGLGACFSWASVVVCMVVQRQHVVASDQGLGYLKELLGEFFFTPTWALDFEPMRWKGWVSLRGEVRPPSMRNRCDLE